VILKFLASSTALAVVIGLSVIGVASPAFAAQPSTVTVKPNESVQSAINTVAPGGVVTLTSGTYVEEILINRSVTLRGSGAVGSVIIQQPAAATPLNLSRGMKLIDIQFTSDVTLENLTLDGSVRVAGKGMASTGIDANSVDGLALNNVIVKGFAKNGIAINGQYKADTKGSSDVSFNSVTAENNGWAGIALYSTSSAGFSADISGVTFTGVTTVAGSLYGIQFGGTGDTRRIQGENGGPVSLGVVVFNNNKFVAYVNGEFVTYASNILVVDTSLVQLDRASTVDGRLATSSDFPFADSLTFVSAAVPTPPVVETPAVQPAARPARIPARVAPPVAQPLPVVTEQTPPPRPATAQRVLTDLGSSTVQLLETYRAVNNGNAPRAVAEVLVIAAGQREGATNAIRSTTNFVASMPWSGSSDDQWVDVWSYSTPTYIGTFPVINGVLKITGADLSALAAGNHHLVLVGQTSGANEVMSYEIAKPASASDDNVTADADTVIPDTANSGATTGSQDLGWLLWVGIAALGVVAITTTGIVIKRRRA